MSPFTVSALLIASVVGGSDERQIRRWLGI